MIDNDMKTQLKEHFKGIENAISLVVKTSEHEKQQELIDMLDDVASCSEKINVVKDDEIAAVPGFSIKKNGEDTGISFSGVPGGHEFSSFVLAVLNSAGLGKMPEESVKQRIEALKGDINLDTYVTLNCPNCPDVVQALNLFAALNPFISHNMIDGALDVEGAKARGVEAVPTVFSGNEVMQVGKTGLTQLLGILEKKFSS